MNETRGAASSYNRHHLESSGVVTKRLEDITFVVQEYSYANVGRSWMSATPSYCLRFIDESWESVVAKLKHGGSWYFTLNPAYDSGLMTGLALDTLKELEALGGKLRCESGVKSEDMLSEILLKFGLAGIEPKCIFVESDEKLKEIREIPSGKILYPRRDDAKKRLSVTKKKTKVPNGRKRWCS